MSSLKTPPKKKAKIKDTRFEEDELPLTQQQERNKVGLKKHSIDLEPDVAYSKMMVDWRRKCYAHGDMLDYLKKDGCIGEMVQEYNKCIKHYSSTSCRKKDIKPSSKVFAGSTTEGTTGSTRTKTEETLTEAWRSRYGAIATQGVYSIGNWLPFDKIDRAGLNKNTPIPKIHDDEDFNIWEKKYCWLCGLPLAFGDEQEVKQSDIYPNQAISCEHKLPLMEMILYGAGVQTAIHNSNFQRTDSTKTTPVGKRAVASKPIRLGEAHIHPQWKEFVRSEGYGWSHHWCNMKKNALPFITVRSWSRQVEDDDEDDMRFQFNMEINNIYQFLLDLFKVEKTEIPEKYGFVPGESYKFNRAEGERNWDPIPLWGDAMGMNMAEFTSFKQRQVENAFSNIVKMLVPTYFLLNSGKEIPSLLKVRRDLLFGRGKGGMSSKRTMFEGIDEVSLIDRFRDNFVRLKSMKIITGDIGAFLRRPELPKIIQSLFACRAGGSSENKYIQSFLEELDKVFKLQGRKEAKLAKYIQRVNSIVGSPEKSRRERMGDFVTNLETIKEKDVIDLTTSGDDESGADESNDDEGAKKLTHTFFDSDSDEENLLSPENSGMGSHQTHNVDESSADESNVGESFVDESETQPLENTQGGGKKKKKRKKRTKKRRRRKKKTRRKRKKKRTKKKRRKRKKRTRRRR